MYPVLRLLDSRLRYRILLLLRDSDYTVGQLAEKLYTRFGVKYPQSTISMALKELHAYHFVSRHPHTNDNRRRVYRIRKDVIRHALENVLSELCVKEFVV